jgi:hypothetical protein
VNFDAGTAYPFTFFFSGPIDSIIVDPNDTSGSTSGPYGTGSDAEEFPVAAGATDRETFMIPTISGTWDPLFYCVDAGTVYPWGSYSSTGVEGSSPGGVDCGTGLVSVTCEGPPTTGGGAFSLSACVSQIGNGLSLTDPVTWVVGLGDFGLCIVEWLFIPAQAQATSFLDFFGLSTNPAPSDAVPVTEYVGGLSHMVAAFPTTALVDAQTAADSGSCNDTGDTGTIDGQGVSVCGALSSVTSGSGTSSRWVPELAVIEEVLSALLYTFFLLALFKLIQNVVFKRSSGGGSSGESDDN